MVGYLYDETGCVFDTLFFLAEYYESAVNKKGTKLL